MATKLRTTCYPYAIRFREGWIRRSTQPPGNCSVLWPWKKLMKMEKRQRERLKHPTDGDLQLGGLASAPALTTHPEGPMSPTNSYYKTKSCLPSNVLCV